MLCSYGEWQLVKTGTYTISRFSQRPAIQRGKGIT